MSVLELVLGISLRFFASEMNRVARDHGDSVAKRIPNQRISIDEDMAGITIFLANKKTGDYGTPGDILPAWPRFVGVAGLSALLGHRFTAGLCRNWT